MAIFSAGLLFLYLHYETGQATFIGFFLLLIVLIVGGFCTYASTSIVFDNQAGQMQKKIWGFVTVKTIPFIALQGINVVNNLNGSYKFRLFRKDARYGRGILLSSAYTKNEDPNAAAFVEEVVARVHQYLDAHDTTTPVQAYAEVLNYRYFDRQGEKYTLKKNKIGNVVFGFLLFALGIHELLPTAWFDQVWSIGRICFLGFTVVGGPLFMLMAFTEITLDKTTQIVEKKNPLGFGNRVYPFNRFLGIRTVRESTNFAYTGTDVILQFESQKQNKEESLVLRRLNKSGQIEQFVTEVNSILKPL